MSIIRNENLALDFDTALDPFDAIRVAVVGVLRGSAELMSNLENDPLRIARRIRKANIDPLPLVTYLDFGSKPDPTVPLTDRIFQFDVWAEDPSIIAAIIISLLDGKPMGMLPGGEANIVYLGMIDDRDDPVDEGDYERKMLTFSLLAYRLVG